MMARRLGPRQPGFLLRALLARRTQSPPAARNPRRFGRETFRASTRIRFGLQWRNHLGGVAPAHLPGWLPRSLGSEAGRVDEPERCGYAGVGEWNRVEWPMADPFELWRQAWSTSTPSPLRKTRIISIS